MLDGIETSSHVLQVDRRLTRYSVDRASFSSSSLRRSPEPGLEAKTVGWVGDYYLKKSLHTPPQPSEAASRVAALILQKGSDERIEANPYLIMAQSFWHRTTEQAILEQRSYSAQNIALL